MKIGAQFIEHFKNNAPLSKFVTLMLLFTRDMKKRKEKCKCGYVTDEPILLYIKRNDMS